MAASSPSQGSLWCGAMVSLVRSAVIGRNRHCPAGGSEIRPYRRGADCRGRCPHRPAVQWAAWYVRRWLVEIAAAQTPHQQSWMENSTHQGARTPGQGRQFKNSSIRRAARATSPQGEACVIAVRFAEILQESLPPTGGSEIRPYGCGGYEVSSDFGAKNRPGWGNPGRKNDEITCEPGTCAYPASRPPG